MRSATVKYILMKTEDDMTDFKVDYHIHTTASDGKSRPTQVVKQAKELGYDIIAITDHDNTDGIQEALIAGEAVGLKVIPGIEIAVETDRGVGLHILGYNVDIENEEPKSFLAQLIASRKKRNIELFETLQSMGYDVSEDDIEVGKNEFIGKPLIARALVRKGYIKNEREAFGPDILGSPKCRKVKKAKPLSAEAIAMLKKIGATPVLAHPIQTRGIGRTGGEEFFKNIELIIRDLKKEGLAGLECYHPDQNAEQSARFVELAEKYHLHITRGSDFHGSDYALAEETADYR